MNDVFFDMNVDFEEKGLKHMLESILKVGLSSLYLTIAYFTLLFRNIKKRYCVCFFLYYTFLLAVITPFLGQATNIFVVSGACILAWLAYDRQLFGIILSLTGYLVGVFVNHLFSVPLSFHGIPLMQIQEEHFILFLLLISVVTLLLLSILNRFFIRPRLSVLQQCPPKLLKLFLLELLIGITLLTVNMIYGESTDYPSHVLAMNGLLITLFFLASLLSFYNLYEILQRSQKLALQQKEQEVMEEYMKQMEYCYEEMRTFRHDYKNILCTMEDYIDAGDIRSLKDFFHDEILPTSDALPGRDFVIGKLGAIHVRPIKSILCIKLGLCQNLGIPFSLEIPGPVDDFFMDSLSLSTILGILLDNAIEAASQCPQPKLEVAVLSTQNGVDIGIRNTALPPTVPMTRLSEAGYTNKTGHSGIGLHTVKKILEETENIDYMTEYKNTTYFVRLHITKAEEKTQ